MSESNVELVRQVFDSFRGGDFESVLPLIHPEFEATTPAELAAEPDTYRGPDGVRRYFESFYEAMDRLSFEADDFIAVGELVVVPGKLTARGRTTGIETEQRVVLVWEVRDGLAYRAEGFATLDEAMEAARRHPSHE